MPWLICTMVHLEEMGLMWFDQYGSTWKSLNPAVIVATNSNISWSWYIYIHHQQPRFWSYWHQLGSFCLMVLQLYALHVDFKTKMWLSPSDPSLADGPPWSNQVCDPLKVKDCYILLAAFLHFFGLKHWGVRFCFWICNYSNYGCFKK